MPCPSPAYRRGEILGPNAALAVRVVTVVADQVLALVGNVLGEFGQEVQGSENLEVAPRFATEVGAGRAGESGSSGPARRDR